MDKDRMNIAVLEPSQIIVEGLSNMLMKLKKNFYIYRYSDLEELKNSTVKEQFQIAFVNPTTIQNRISDFVKLKNNYPQILWIALVYSFFDDEVIRKFDETLLVTATPDQIARKLGHFNTGAEKNQQEDLSEREIEVLSQLVKGLSNKEIADKLNISIHTVISHRKNIIEKTGIKSLSGLTIYAITRKIIHFDIYS
ncbi:MAG: transcriptional regulator LuxR [Prolixibacteraceae bacterium]|nr:MAG: transcriptional regulator LuxR [Prolixibacteraceae bacterium]